MLDPIRRAITARSSVEHAFDAFTTALGEWWPAQYTWSGRNFDAAVLIPRAGGRWFERCVYGRECDWGRVVLWEPPRRVVLTFGISPDRLPESDPAKAGEIEIRFTSEGEFITKVELEHRGFERHGKGAEALRAGMDSNEGWTEILGSYLATIERQSLR